MVMSEQGGALMTKAKRLGIAVVVACGTVLAMSQVVADAVMPHG
jgi:hypothetical protein